MCSVAKKWMVSIIVCGSLMVWLSGCQSLIQKPQVVGVSLRYANIERSSQTLGVQLGVRNPNLFSIPIQSGAATLAVDGQTFGEGTLLHAVDLPADRTVQIIVPIKIDAALLKNYLPIILLEEQLSYAISGQITVEGRIYSFTDKGVLTLSEAKKMFGI